MSRGLLVSLAVVAHGCCGPAGEARDRESETGFVSIAMESYRLVDEELTSGGAALFYDYQPTTSDDEAAPLFVVTAGGPGMTNPSSLATGGLVTYHSRRP